MSRVLVVVVIFASGLLLGLCLRETPRTALAGGEVKKCAAQNGDVNADGEINLTDAITILGHLFLGAPTELVPLCAPPPSASGVPATGQTQCYGFVEGQWIEVPCTEAA